MDAKVYKGYSIWGHAIRQGHEYAASGAITRNNKLIETLGALGSFESDDEAELVGLIWRGLAERRRDDGRRCRETVF